MPTTEEESGKSKRVPKRLSAESEKRDGTIDLQGVSMSYYEEMKEIFKIFDADGSGAIDPKEIREQMISLGFVVDNTTIYQLISDLDSDGSQKLEFDEFFVMLRDTLEIHKDSFNSRHNFVQIFDFLDDLDPQNRDGKIDCTNLRRLANVLGDDIADAEIELMVQRADPEGKGYVAAEDFYQLMMSCATKMQQEPELPKETPSPLEAETAEEPDLPSPPSSPSGARGRRSNPASQRGSRYAMRRSMTTESLQIETTKRKSKRESMKQRSSVQRSSTVSLSPRSSTMAAGGESRRSLNKSRTSVQFEGNARRSSQDSTTVSNSSTFSLPPKRSSVDNSTLIIESVPEAVDENSNAGGMD
jgi:Ca2+-binding EF-hand superfamily protein